MEVDLTHVRPGALLARSGCQPGRGRDTEEDRLMTGSYNHEERAAQSKEVAKC